MKAPNSNRLDADAGNSKPSASSTVPCLGTKKDLAAMLQMSVRSVDNYLAAGCPVIMLSKRRCRFDLAEVRDWFKAQYGQRRRGPAKRPTSRGPEQAAEGGGAV